MASTETRPRSPTHTLRAALATTVAATAAPYGYTVTLWSSGAVLTGTHGTPHIAEVFTYLAGALAGFGLIALIAHRTLGRTELLNDAADRVLAATLDILAVCGAVGAVALLAQIHTWQAWPLSAFTATTLYLLLAGLQLTAVANRRKRRLQTDPHTQ